MCRYSIRGSIHAKESHAKESIDCRKRPVFYIDEPRRCKYGGTVQFCRKPCRIQDAGLYGRAIDSVQMEFYGVEGYEVKYRVAPVNDVYLPFVYDYNVIDDDGFAGEDGCSIDRLQVVIVKKK